MSRNLRSASLRRWFFCSLFQRLWTWIWHYFLEVFQQAGDWATEKHCLRRRNVTFLTSETPKELDYIALRRVNQSAFAPYCCASCICARKQKASDEVGPWCWCAILLLSWRAKHTIFHSCACDFLNVAEAAHKKMAQITATTRYANTTLLTICSAPCHHVYRSKEARERKSVQFYQSWINYLINLTIWT